MLSKMTNDEQEAAEVPRSWYSILPPFFARMVPAKRLEPGPFLTRAGMVRTMVGN
jgi:hypothetical protein